MLFKKVEMKRPDSKTFLLFLLKLTIICNLGTFFNQGLTVEASFISSVSCAESPTDDGSNLLDRVSEIEAQNRQHVKEISLLKTTVSEDKKMISQLNGRLSLLEASANVINTAANSNEDILGRSKRPARLIPFHFLL